MATRSRTSALALVLAGAVAAAAPPAAPAARTATLSLSPARAQAGAKIGVVGRRFPARARVRLYLGGKRLKSLRTNRRGRFRTRLKVPAGTPRLYRLTARAPGVRVRVRFRLLSSPKQAQPPPQQPLQPVQQQQASGSTGTTSGTSGTTGSTSGTTGTTSGTTGTTSGTTGTTSGTTGTTSGTGPPPPATLVAAGDIACAPPGTATAATCHQAAVSDLVQSLDPDIVATLGDNQYEHGELANFTSVFDPTWGRFKSKIRPVPGNHEYDADHMTAPGYYSYFGAGAGDPTQGYYTYSIGGWQVFVLNSGDLNQGPTPDCWPVSCAAGSDQETWLRSQLAALPADTCVIGAFHHPHHASDTPRAHPAELSALYDDLYDYGAELLLTGHSHTYERFAPMSDAMTLDANYGVREFVVGTGGRSLFTTPASFSAGSEKFDNSHFGALELELSPGSYTFRFLGEDGAVLDQGSGSCHGPHP